MTYLASDSRHSTIFVYRPPPLSIQQPLEIAATALHCRTTQPPKDRLQSCAIQITKGPGVDTSFPPQKSLSRPGHSTWNKPVYSSPRSCRHLVILCDSDEDQDLADRLLTGRYSPVPVPLPSWRPSAQRYDLIAHGHGFHELDRRLTGAPAEPVAGRPPPIRAFYARTRQEGPLSPITTDQRTTRDSAVSPSCLAVPQGSARCSSTLARPRWDPTGHQELCLGIDCV